MRILACCAAALGLLAVSAPVSVLAEVSAPAEPVGNDCLTASPAGCYSPQQFRTAYDVQPLLGRGVDGRGDTVTVVVYDAGPVIAPPQVTDIRQDLALLDRVFRLPPARASAS